MRTLTKTILAATGLALAAPALAQTNPPAHPQPPQAGGEPGFFRPAADPRLTTLASPPAPRPVTPAAPSAPAPAASASTFVTPDMADEVRRAEEARLERMEATMDRIESRNERAVAEANRRAPVIASPMDGTAQILSPLDGTAPLVSGLGR